MRCIHSATVLTTALLASLIGIGSTPAAAASCASLLGLVLPDTEITAAAPDNGAFGELPAFCRVTATLRPTSDSDINIEVWMPFSAWNGKFLGLGTHRHRNLRHRVRARQSLLLGS